MKFTYLAFFLAFVVNFSVITSLDRCQKACTLDYRPVCARRVDPETFAHKCVLDYEECKTDIKYTIVSQGECPAVDGDVNTQTEISDGKPDGKPIFT